MKILLSDIPDEGLNVALTEKIVIEDATLLSPVRASLELVKTGREVIISGTMGAELELQCSRCLKPFTRTIDLPVGVVYHPIEEIGAERHELKGDEMDMGFYRGEEIDLQELIREQIVLNLQMKPLCDETCKGICPSCGADLNAGDCGCIKREIDPRLEILKKLLEKRKE